MVCARLGWNWPFGSGKDLFVCSGVFVPLENYSVIWRHHHYRQRAANVDLTCFVPTRFDEDHSLTSWHKVSLGKGIQVCSNEGPPPSQRGDNWEIIKINWQLLKIFFYRTTGPISTKLGTKCPLVKGIQVCTNEGSCPTQKGDNWEMIIIKTVFEITTIA